MGLQAHGIETNSSHNSAAGANCGGRHVRYIGLCCRSTYKCVSFEWMVEILCNCFAAFGKIVPVETHCVAIATPRVTLKMML